MADRTPPLGAVYQRVWDDSAYKQRLLQDPGPVPAGTTVVAHESTASTLHFVLPGKEQFAGVDVAAADPVVGKVMAQAWADAGFKARLLADPKPAITEATGLTPPDSMTIRVFENTPQQVHLVLPANPKSASAELSDEDLDQVAGGAKGAMIGGGQAASDRCNATAAAPHSWGASLDDGGPAGTMARLVGTLGSMAILGASLIGHSWGWTA